MNSASLGILTPEEFEQCRKASFGGAGKIIRKKAPLWGKTSGSEADLKEFRVTVNVRASFTETATVDFVVKAASPEDAQDQAEEMATEKHFAWSCDEPPESIDYDAEEAKELK